jgi:hypothetical protein
MRNVRLFVTAIVCALSLGAVVVPAGIEGSGLPVAGIQGSGVIVLSSPASH